MYHKGEIFNMLPLTKNPSDTIIVSGKHPSHESFVSLDVSLHTYIQILPN